MTKCIPAQPMEGLRTVDWLPCYLKVVTVGRKVKLEDLHKCTVKLVNAAKML